MGRSLALWLVLMAVAKDPRWTSCEGPAPLLSPGHLAATTGCQDSSQSAAGALMLQALAPMLNSSHEKALQGYCNSSAADLVSLATKHPGNSSGTGALTAPPSPVHRAGLTPFIWPRDQSPHHSSNLKGQTLAKAAVYANFEMSCSHFLKCNLNCPNAETHETISELQPSYFSNISKKWLKWFVSFKTWNSFLYSEKNTKFQANRVPNNQLIDCSQGANSVNCQNPAPSNSGWVAGHRGLWGSGQGELKVLPLMGTLNLNPAGFLHCGTNPKVRLLLSNLRVSTYCVK